MATRVAFALFLLPWYVVALRGQDGADTPRPNAPVANVGRTAQQDAVAFHKKIFWAMVGVYGASMIADIQTSYSVEQRFPTGTEFNDWLYGRRPSLARYYATDLAIDSACIFLSYKLLHSRRKWFRGIGWTLLAGQTASHTSAAIYNSHH
jgi:hypothetical protein